MSGRKRHTAEETRTGDDRRGRIVTRYGAEMLVEDEGGLLHRCTARRRLEHAVCGDRVRWQPAEQGNDIVTAIEPRHNVLERPDHAGRAKPLAANIDRLLVVLAAEPPPSGELVDRYLVAAMMLDAHAAIVVNKCDKGLGAAEVLVNEFRALGCPVLETSAATGKGIAALADLMRGGTNILVGQSGVGKSSLVKALLPDIDIRIGDLSLASGEGRHTTTAATLYHLPDGGDLIDSPGVRDFMPASLDTATVHRGFVEIAALAADCRFADCSHRNEPGCAVRQAVQEGRVSERRYASYLALLRETAEARR